MLKYIQELFQIEVITKFACSEGNVFIVVFGTKKIKDIIKNTSYSCKSQNTLLSHFFTLFTAPTKSLRPPIISFPNPLERPPLISSPNHGYRTFNRWIGQRQKIKKQFFSKINSILLKSHADYFTVFIYLAT